ncbi:hypothetical protein PZ895_08135 [Mesorhizobium sp. YIM 152430]|uniref:hypothetical protein n=1 Tax=Mesorhizobium sp. YIM 152430 TaxID=3031761 RepID=UPI0023DB7AA6|nr:hypothetical protein [Mesorhizobium sp. YIM 152430]MDF1599745.1 hypothetical protein [Mesorhizobium sp. YIM 152430]
MNDALADPRRIQIARHIMDARKLAIELDAQVLDYLLESALKETLGHDAATRTAVLQRPDDREA